MQKYFERDWCKNRTIGYFSAWICVLVSVWEKQREEESHLNFSERGRGRELLHFLALPPCTPTQPFNNESASGQSGHFRLGIVSCSGKEIFTAFCVYLGLSRAGEIPWCEQEAGAFFLGLAVTRTGVPQVPLVAGGQGLGQAASLLLRQHYIGVPVLLGVWQEDKAHVSINAKAFTQRPFKGKSSHISA